MHRSSSNLIRLKEVIIGEATKIETIMSKIRVGVTSRVGEGTMIGGALIMTEGAMIGEDTTEAGTGAAEGEVAVTLVGEIESPSLTQQVPPNLPCQVLKM